MTAIESLSRVCGEVTVAVSDEDSCSEEDDDVSKLTLPKVSDMRTVLHDAVNQQGAGIVEELLSSEPYLSTNEETKKKIKSECASSSIQKSHSQPEDDELPSYLDLEWIYGYNSTDCSNVHYLSSPEDDDKKGCRRFVYPAASQGIVYDKVEGEKGIFTSWVSGHRLTNISFFATRFARRLFLSLTPSQKPKASTPPTPTPSSP